MRTADDWHQRGLALEDLSRFADSSREYREDVERAQKAFDLAQLIRAGLGKQKTVEDWLAQGRAIFAFAESPDYQRDVADAVEAFDQALALDPTHHVALRERGFALAALNQPDAALDSFVAAASQLPDDAELMLAVGAALVKGKQFDRALSAFEKVLELRPGDEDARVGRAQTLVTLGRDEPAVAAWDEVLLAGSGGREYRWTEALLERALALDRLGRAEAFAAFTVLIEAEAKPVTGPVLRKRFNHALASSEMARSAFRRFLETRTADVWTMQKAADAWLESGQPVEALVAFDAVLALRPEDADAWFWKGEAHTRLAQRDEAIAAYRQALVFRPEFPRAKDRLSEVTRGR